MKGAGSSMRQDLDTVARTPDNLRSRDIVVGTANPDHGCSWVTTRGVVVERCEGPPDWKDGGRWYCLDHIDKVLCCGYRMSADQKRQVLANPKRAVWLARQRQVKSRAEKAKEAMEKEFPQEVTAESGFSWREHLARINGANR